MPRNPLYPILPSPPLTLTTYNSTNIEAINKAIIDLEAYRLVVKG
jgi:hypothetical protein